MTPAEAVRGFLDALGVPRRAASRRAWTRRSALYRSLLAGRRMLVVLDNARDAEQVRPLLPGTPGCLVLVTSRNRLAGLVAAEGARAARRSTCSPPPRPAQLLARRLGADRVGGRARRRSTRSSNGARGCRWRWPSLAARAAAHPGASRWPPSPPSCASAAGGWTRFDGGDTGHRRAGGLLLVVPDPDRAGGATVPAARRCTRGRTSASPPRPAWPACPAARRGRCWPNWPAPHLLTEHTPGRYTFHDLLRGVRRRAGRRHDRRASGDAAVRRGARPLPAHRARGGAAAATRAGTRSPWPPPRPGSPPERLADHGAALAWFAAEHPVLLAAVAHAAPTPASTAMRGSWPGRCGPSCDRRGHWHDLAATQQAALAGGAAARRPGRAGARPPRPRPVPCRLGRLDEAAAHYRAGPDLFGALGDHTGQARTHRAFGAMLTGSARYAEALEHAQQALALYRAAGHCRGGQRPQRGRLGARPARPVRAGAGALPAGAGAAAATGDRHGEANTWDSLGFIHDRLGQHRRAIRCYRRALALYRRIGDRYDEADTLTRLGETRQAAGDATAPCGPGGGRWTSSTTSAIRTPPGSVTDCTGSRPGSRRGTEDPTPPGTGGGGRPVPGGRAGRGQPVVQLGTGMPGVPVDEPRNPNEVLAPAASAPL